LIPRIDDMDPTPARQKDSTRRALCALALLAGIAATAPVAAETPPTTSRALLVVSAVVMSRCGVSLQRLRSAPRVDCGRDRDTHQVAPPAPGLDRTTEVAAIDATTRIVEVTF
jgi:hypothetical protein